MGKGKKEKFQIADPQEQLDKILQSKSKYKIGEKGYSFHEIRDLKPVFAFDYLSLNETSLCYNSKNLDIKDYIGLLEGLKKVSEFSYNSLRQTHHFRFHKIDFNDTRLSITKKDFKSKLTFKEDLLKDEELPNLYQFDLQYVQEARACGFLYIGVFYLVWYDRFHEIYGGE